MKLYKRGLEVMGALDQTCAGLIGKFDVISGLMSETAPRNWKPVDQIKSSLAVLGNSFGETECSLLYRFTFLLPQQKVGPDQTLKIRRDSEGREAHHSPSRKRSPKPRTQFRRLEPALRFAAGRHCPSAGAQETMPQVPEKGGWVPQGSA